MFNHTKSYAILFDILFVIASQPMIIMQGGAAWTYRSKWQQLMLSQKPVWSQGKPLDGSIIWCYCQNRYLASIDVIA